MEVWHLLYITAHLGSLHSKEARLLLFYEVDWIGDLHHILPAFLSLISRSNYCSKSTNLINLGFASFLANAYLKATWSMNTITL